ncbi:heavy-metal-associated domain-containing protein [Sphingosinicella rhizophila]|uniref:Heavy-metal-associated domain-containing protein n=1 Tax=Sphingosinicella rhizophila TaxID=3050082 RepID=A0ABU3Q2V9_9SPHN|nr:heavy-metal-associated domain-containing protein [Sphingosinicella sp. GR2756]MDT9597719.1 heavy-metal-associated domain-containing protein [Sphingosinicella sp. GR2756]
MKSFRRLPALAALLLLMLAAGGVVYAQLEGADRGVPPIDSANTLEVTGIRVDVAADTSEKARYEGWRQAQLKGWKALWAKTNGRPQSEAPSLSESALNAMISGIIIEDEQIGPKRYVATLGLLFDRARTGQLLGISGPVRRSAPMLVIPIMITGATPYSFEYRNEWQKAWARFRTGNSPIDYVRPAGSGIDPLLLNPSQTRRPGRGWWRLLVDQYGAADIVVPEVHLRRLYPGGPAIGIFTARHGADNVMLDRFTLRAGNSSAIPRMLDEGVRRLDIIYARALGAGLLKPDPSLITQEPEIVEELEEADDDAVTPISTPIQPVPIGTASSFTIQVETPDAASVGQAELSVSRIGGITSAITTSLALGGTSVMKVTYMGDADALRSALQAQGWNVQGSGSSIRISRGGGGQ